MTAQHYILATAGHVDHGKSALVKALTGTDPDRLPEEKARGITIDLGFAHLDLAAPGPPPHTYHLGLVDVPGHEDFVKNMVAGVGSIDLALFVVAADDGWMPQTEEHLQILTYLGVTRSVVALTKIDLAGGAQDAIVGGLREKLGGSPFADAPIVATSVVTGQGLEELKAALVQVLASTPLPRDIGKPRLPVDRVFSLRGIGTVVTGTLTGGTLRRGQPVIIQPTGQTTRVRSLQSHNQDVELSAPGTRTALNLPDSEARSAGNPGGVVRGEVITLPELGPASDTADVLLERSARSSAAPGDAGRKEDLTRTTGHRVPIRPLRDGTVVSLHHGSGHYAARILLQGGGALMPGQRALAQVRFDTPVLAFAGDHFIVRDWAEQATLAGGVILDPDANRKAWRREAQRLLLERRAEPGADVGVFVASQLRRDSVGLPALLLVKSRFSAAEIAAAVNRLVAEGKLVRAGDLLADAGWWRDLRQQAAETIDAEHRARPERAGLPLRDLRAALQEHRMPPGTLEALVADLLRKDFRQTGAFIARATHRPALPSHLQSSGAKVRAALAAKPLEPPSRKEIAPDPSSQQALRFLIETGEALEVGPDVVLLGEAFQSAVEIIKAHLRQQGSGTVSGLRQLLGSSRRIMVPLLEKLDRDGVTKRQGDVRTLGPNG